MKFLILFIASCLGVDIREVFPDYTDEEFGVENPYYFNASQLDETHERGRNLVEYSYYTETEKDCQACLTRAWNHCRIDWRTHICCPPNNETGACT